MACSKLYKGFAFGRTFPAADNSAPDQTWLWPNNAMFLVGNADGVNDAVNSVLGVSYAKTNNSSVFGEKFVAMGDPGLTNVKYVGLELDIMPFAGTTPSNESIGFVLNGFNADIPGPAMQIGAIGGSWLNGLMLGGIHSTGAALVSLAASLCGLALICAGAHSASQPFS